jgi:hypothetical protein
MTMEMGKTMMKLWKLLMFNKFFTRTNESHFEFFKTLPLDRKALDNSAKHVSHSRRELGKDNAWAMQRRGLGMLAIHANQG